MTPPEGSGAALPPRPGDATQAVAPQPEETARAVTPLPQDAAQAGPGLAADILASLEGRLSRMKWPRSIDFTGEMPRDPSGKLLKRRLREPYWVGTGRSV